jgi:23S rRNA pseudouridine2605 synthase
MTKPPVPKAPKAKTSMARPSSAQAPAGKAPTTRAPTSKAAGARAAGGKSAANKSGGERAQRPQLHDPKQNRGAAPKRTPRRGHYAPTALSGASEAELQQPLAAEKLDGEKLQKVLARAGLGSRRDMEKIIAEGQVTVNGQLAQLGDRIGADDKVALKGAPLELRSAAERQTRVLIYNKPEGEICTARDPEGRPTVFDRLPRLRGERWIAVGRLDFNTSGLLLFTTDGELANALMHPSSNIDREYLCRVMGEVSEDKLANLKEGVMLDDGIARFNDITEGGGSDTSINRWFYVCLMEGRNREVRRLWESQELKVNRLKRVRYGPVFLPAKVKQGQWMDLPPEEIRGLYERANLRLPEGKRSSFNRRAVRGERERSEKPRGARTPRRPRSE